MRWNGGEHEAQSGDFNAIVTDNDMPRMNGLEFVHSVLEIGFKGRITVDSSLLKSEDLQDYQTHSVSGFIRMPFDIKWLATMLLQGS